MQVLSRNDLPLPAIVRLISMYPNDVVGDKE